MIPMSEQARAIMSTDADRRGAEACYTDPDITLPAPRGSVERRIGYGWVLVVRPDGTVDRAFRRNDTMPTGVNRRLARRCGSPVQ